jgi:23S rRNA (uridine2552-2'-O)-methyltransferase
MKRRSKTSQWHRRHVKDPWVQRAQKAGYRSRAAFKLEEILASEQLIRPGCIVADLGAAPGGWSQVAVKALRGQGGVYGIDLLPLDSVPGATFLQGDFRDDALQAQLLALAKTQKLDVVLSDMSPDLTGIKAADQAKSIGLCEAVLAFAAEHLDAQGVLLIKVFQGVGFDEFFRDFKATFKSVKTKKPKASRDQSKETYLLGRGLRPDEA